MSDQERQRAQHVPIWGIFLLFLGIVFLLQSFNILPWGLWGTLWRFWPVLLIIVGVGIVLRRYNVWLASMLILALLFACLGIAIWQYEPSSQVGQTTKSYSKPLNGLEKAQIEIDFDGGSLTMSSLPPDSLNFVEVGSEVRGGIEGLEADFSRHGSEGGLHLSREKVNWQFWNEAGARAEIKLNRNVPLIVDIKSAASNVDLDLSQLQITELRMDIDLGNCIVKMPSSAGTIYSYIKADLANLEVIIPEGVAAKVKADIDLGTLEVDENRFPRKDGYYMSRDFETAKNRVELELDFALSRVRLK